jgi:hypothetical protein
MDKSIVAQRKKVMIPAIRLQRCLLRVARGECFLDELLVSVATGGEDLPVLLLASSPAQEGAGQCGR